MLYPYLHAMVEPMVKALDPNHPILRESLQDIITLNFAELVKIFPNIAFHAGSQRLAIGNLDGTTIVYDLRTATQLLLLKELKGRFECPSVHGVTFSSTGQLIGTLSCLENRMSFWQPPSGFLGSIMGALSGSGHHVELSLPFASHKLSPFRTFNLGPPMNHVALEEILDKVKFEWSAERSLCIHSVGGITLKFNI